MKYRFDWASRPAPKNLNGGERLESWNEKEAKGATKQKRGYQWATAPQIAERVESVQNENQNKVKAEMLEPCFYFSAYCKLSEPRARLTHAPVLTVCQRVWVSENSLF